MNKNSKGIITILIIIIILLVVFITLLLSGVISLKKDVSSNKPENSNELLTEEVNNNDNATSNSNETLSKNYEQKKTISNSQLMDIYKDFVIDMGDGASYGIVDINSDGIYELITKTGTCEADYVYNFYSYDENIESKTFILIGSIPAGHKVLYKMNDNTLMSVTGHMNAEHITYFYIDNAWLIRIPGKDSSRYVENASDYKTGDEIVEFVETNNITLFEKYR